MPYAEAGLAVALFNLSGAPSMRSTRTFLFSTTVLAGVIAAASPVFAQSAPVQDPETSRVEEVVVTGSRIRRVDPANAPQPLIQLGRDEILQSGQPNLIDFLADIPALQGSQVPEDTTGNVLGTGGLATLNLRNLGSERTLVLIDGRRHVGAPQGSLVVDVDTIPSALIQSVEIVTGGSAAVYGADAVAGVVNFIMRRDFEGLEIDTNLSQINSGGELNGRFSLTVGKNFFDDRLNLYAFGEYQENEAVKDRDIAWKARGEQLVTVDADLAPGPNFDGVYDARLVSGLRDIRFSPGGILTLANQVLPNANIPIQSCGATGSQTANNSYGGAVIAVLSNCFAADPGRTFVFNQDGASFRPVNFGSFRAAAPYSRNLTVDGDGENPLFAGQEDRIPKQTASRFQAGANFRLTDDVQVFLEGKYVEEETTIFGSAPFFDIGIGNLPTNTLPSISYRTLSPGVFNIGLDNAYLPTDMRNAILTNTRAVINAQGVVTNPSLLDQRATLSVSLTDFAGARFQVNNRTLERYVAGIRGSRDSLFFVKDFDWEISGTYGKTENTNFEGGALDVERFQFQVDAVRDTAGIVNGTPGQIVCRVQLLAARGIAMPDQLRGGNIDPNSATVRNCAPARLFGTGGFSDAAKAYSAAAISINHVNEQTNVVAFASGNLWDFWGAGAIGVAMGLEYRKEEAVGFGRSESTGDRFLFLNTGANFPASEYDTKEFFAEVRLPLLRNMPGAELLEISGAYRTSDYSTVGKQDTFNVTGVWRPIQDILFRASYGEAIRVPSLSNSFALQTQTFANGLVDPCDFQAINAQTPEIQANRRVNCAALLGSGYSSTSTSLPSSSVPGFNQGNPNLKPETSESFTFSTVFTPRFIPNLSIVLDYYDIEVRDVIAAVSVQNAVNRCVSTAVIDPNACNTFTRAPSTATVPFAITSFIQGNINYAATNNSGVDFTVRYSQDLDELTGHNLGQVSYSMRGNWLIRQDDFTNLLNPAQQTSFAGSIEMPRFRFQQAITYAPVPDLAFTWNLEFQSAQEIVNRQTLLTNPDSRIFSQFYTRDYFMHDLSVRWQATDQVLVRGGVVNVFDRAPDAYLGNTNADTFDFFGRRFFIGVNYKY